MRRYFLPVLLSLLLAGCMVGPNFHRPCAPNTKTYTHAPQPTKTVGKTVKTQYFVSKADIPGQWWTLYHSPALNNLIVKGLANSPNLAAAKASLRQAQYTYRAQWGNLMLPQVNGTFSAQRQRFSSATIGDEFPSSIFNTFNATVNVSYTFDVFGASRRQLEALCAQVDYQNFQLQAAYLTLTSNIVTTTITIASLQAQIKATHELIQSQADQLAIVKKQFKLGGASRADVLSQDSQLASTTATLPPLQQSLAQSRHMLAILIGELPSESDIPMVELDALILPGKIPISIPSLLVRQRPDIRASEALLHAASAQVGVATANLYPQITLTGTNYGWTSPVLPHLINPANNIWGIGGQLLQPIFNGGALRYQRCAAIAAYEQAAAQYKQTVLQAFKNVADSLRAVENDAKLLQAQKWAEVSARDSLNLTLKQYRLGGVSYLNLLTAQRQYQQARIGRIQAQAARFNDTAALFQALGGGWWNVC